MLIYVEKKFKKKKKKLKKEYSLKLRAKFFIKSFIKTIPYHILVIGSVSIISFIFNKWIEALCFLIAFFSLRYKFPTTYHADTVLVCMILTNLIFGISIIFCPPIYMYIFASILYAYIDCLVLWIIQDRIECKRLIKKLTSKTIWQMSENELVDYCYAKGVRGDMLEFVVMILIHQIKYEEIGKQLGYAVPTLKEWSKICKKKLGIQSWKN